jgi:hypothetical protein
MLEFVAKVPFEMFKAVPVRTLWENRRDTIQQTLLTIGEDGELFFEVCRINKLGSRAFNDGMEDFKEPVPIPVVFCIDESKANWKQLSQCIDTSGRKQDP